MSYLHVTVNDQHIIWIERERITVWGAGDTQPRLQQAGTAIGLSIDENLLLLQRGERDVVVWDLASGDFAPPTPDLKDRFQPHQQVQTSGFIPDRELDFRNVFDNTYETYHFLGGIYLATQVTSVMPPAPYCLADIVLESADFFRTVTALVDMRSKTCMGYIEIEDRFVIRPGSFGTHFIASWRQDYTVREIDTHRAILRWNWRGGKKSEREIMMSGRSIIDPTAHGKEAKIDALAYGTRYRFAVCQAGAIYLKDFNEPNQPIGVRLADIPRGTTVKAMAFSLVDFVVYGVVTANDGRPSLQRWRTQE